MNVTFLDIIELLTFGFALTFGLFLQRHQQGNQTAHRILSCFLFIVAIESVNYLIHSQQWVLSYPWLANTGNNFGILMGTTLYFYARALTDNHFAFKRSDVKHLLPLVLIVSYNLMFYHSVDSSQQLQILQGQPSLWSEYIMTIIVLAHCVIFGYIVGAFLVLKNNGIKLRRVLSDIEPFNLSWLRGVLLVIFVIWFIRVTKIPLQFAGIDGLVVEVLTVVQNVLALAAVVVLLFKALGQHPVFTDALADLAMATQEQEQAHALQVDDLSKITDTMAAQKLWQQPSLTLSELAGAVGLPAKTVSALLNDDLNKNFFEFVNGLRCTEAADLLGQSDNSVLDIAFAVGFNSKTAFNRAFKKQFSLTPSQYRKQQVTENK